MKRISLFLVLVLALAGCTQVEKQVDRRSSSGEDFRKGTEGLVLSYLPDAPPQKIFGEGEVRLAVQLKNKGASQIDLGNVWISGYDSSIITGMQRADGISKLAGKGLYDPEGEFEVKEFQGNINLGQGINTYKPTFIATACYDYETIASPLVCIDSDPFSLKAKAKTCKPGAVKISGGQGAPIAITGVDVSATSRKTSFAIHIQNLGKGMLYAKGSQNCDPYSGGLSQSELDWVTIDEVTVAGENIKASCSPAADKVKLIGGKRTIFCEKNTEPNTPPFQSPLTIRLSYGYSSSISKPVEIVRAP